MNLTKVGIQLVQAAIEAVKPDRLIQEQVAVDGDTLVVQNHRVALKPVEQIFVVGMGKASASMALALEAILGERITDGAVVVKYGHGAPCRRVRVLEGGHPIVDRKGLKATEQVVALCQKAGPRDLVICLISGGGSALLEKIPPGITLDELQQTFQLLLHSGATIEQVNTVRKHLSLVKGGQLARFIAPAACLSLILSDVIGDPLEAIASGPTAPDATSFQDAWNVVERFGLVEQLPDSVRRYLRQGVKGQVPETVKPGDPLFRRVTNMVLGNNFRAVKTIERQARELGWHPLILTTRLQGEAREVARVLAALVEEEAYRALPVPRPACLILGGETTVTIRGTGKGGRNQELALAALLALKKLAHPYLLLSCGTDGTDGPTDAAGAWACGPLWQKARQLGLNPEEFLKNNDSYHFFEQVGGLIKTGPTGTNVMDVIVALIPEPSQQF